jgi:hypothetical protein
LTELHGGQFGKSESSTDADNWSRVIVTVGTPGLE